MANGKGHGFNVEGALAAAGIDVAAAKASIAAYDEAFGGEVGDIPDGVLVAWINEHFDSIKVRKFLILLGKAWEADHSATLPADRKWEREPGAAEEKAKRNLAKQMAKAGK